MTWALWASLVVVALAGADGASSIAESQRDRTYESWDVEQTLKPRKASEDSDAVESLWSSPWKKGHRSAPEVFEEAGTGTVHSVRQSEPGRAEPKGPRQSPRKLRAEGHSARASPLARDQPKESAGFGDTVHFMQLPAVGQEEL
ncbi:hypothetical protein AK812_SmicGene31005 [Symbiodinium microadriaticum]|uniref:Uncharacterized protein n=1 Tax=Symbiodinium microadriaticum TaxID=2951 RepID=A0A1Q9CXU5_SYMMI|nr:hypothetical protein AK812_SmicGene31005 [Symbiodinium microadriaticum]